MTTTVHEILKLKKFSNFKLVAGVNGLDRIVSRGGFIDHESAEDIRSTGFINEMIFSNLYFIKNEPEKIVDYVQAIIDAGCSCFAIKTTIFKEFPEEAIRLANTQSFPLFLFEDTYIEELILDIDNRVNYQKNIKLKIDIVKEIEGGTLDSFKIRGLAFELNSDFKEKAIVCSFWQKNDSKVNLNLNSAEKIIGKSSLLIPYKSYYLLIISYSESEHLDVRSLLDSLGVYSTSFNVGLSTEIVDYAKLDTAIHESRLALKYSLYKNQFMSNFKNLGIFQVLLHIMNDRWSYRYYETIIQKLISYDQKHKSELLNTACTFIDCEGDVNTTSEVLYQHSNTVRYRIKKIKSILGFEDLTGMKYETLAVAIHLYKLNKNLSSKDFL